MEESSTDKDSCLDPNNVCKFTQPLSYDIVFLYKTGENWFNLIHEDTLYSRRVI